MIGSFEPDCKCTDDKGNSCPHPKITYLQIEKIPIEVEYIIECRKCNKQWKETCLVYGVANNGNHNTG